MAIKPQFKPIVHWFFGLGYPIIAIIVSVVCLSVHRDYVHSSEALGTSSLILTALVIFAIIVLFLGYKPAKQKRMGVASILSIIIVASAIGYTGALANDKIIEGVKVNLHVDAPSGWSVKITIYDESEVYSIRELTDDPIYADNEPWYIVQLKPGHYNLTVEAYLLQVVKVEYPKNFNVFPQEISDVDIIAVGTS